MARLTGYSLVRTPCIEFLLDKKTVDSVLSTVWGSEVPLYFAERLPQSLTL